MCVEATNAMTWKLAVSVVPLVPENKDADSLYVKMSFRLGDNRVLTENGERNNAPVRDARIKSLERNATPRLGLISISG
jgi:hypothetical protein